MRNDLAILISKANNGVGIAVIATAPGGSPYPPLARWFEMKGYKRPMDQARGYRVIKLLTDCTSLEDVAVAVLENFDGDVVTGDRAPRKFDNYESGQYLN